MSDDADAANQNFWASGKGFGILSIIILSMWIANFFIMPHFFGGSSSDLSNAGAVGDMFGSLTALFSGLAFAGLITTLFMQRVELTLQRKELSQTREVFKIQRFENTLFGLMKLLNDHVNSIEISNRDLGYIIAGGRHLDENKGRHALKLISQNLPETEKKIKNGPSYDLNVTATHILSHKELTDSYSDYYHKYLESHLGPYFRLIYAVIRLIESEKFSDDPDADFKVKKEYSKIFRAHLSDAEIRLLMLNCASIQGAGLKGWVEKYGLLRHLSRGDFEKYSVLVEYFRSEAFEGASRKGNSPMPT
tara:strand:+ start:316 stop:1233 length:918 start_codon:yes stop_codon:yes gene_type:complete